MGIDSLILKESRLPPPKGISLNKTYLGMEMIFCEEEES